MAEPGQGIVAHVTPGDEQQFVGVHDAPEIYIDGFQGVAINNGAVKISLFSVQVNPSDAVAYRKVVATLSMTIPTLVQVQSAFGTILNEFERDGLIKRVVGGGKNAAD